jgi:hypothetical protein
MPDPKAPGAATSTSAPAPTQTQKNAAAVAKTIFADADLEMATGNLEMYSNYLQALSKLGARDAVTAAAFLAAYHLGEKK